MPDLPRIDCLSCDAVAESHNEGKTYTCCYCGKMWAVVKNHWQEVKRCESCGKNDATHFLVKYQMNVCFHCLQIAKLRANRPDMDALGDVEEVGKRC